MDTFTLWSMTMFDLHYSLSIMPFTTPRTNTPYQKIHHNPQNMHIDLIELNFQSDKSEDNNVFSKFTRSIIFM